MRSAQPPHATTAHLARRLLQVRDFLSRKDIKPDSSLGERLLQYFEFTVEGGESGGDAAVTEQVRLSRTARATSRAASRI